MTRQISGTALTVRCHGCRRRGRGGRGRRRRHRRRRPPRCDRTHDLPHAEIQKHIDRQWVKTASTKGLLDYWVKHSIEPNGFIQENLDQQWKPWGTQREATINGQGRQLVIDRHRLRDHAVEGLP